MTDFTELDRVRTAALALQAAIIDAGPAIARLSQPGAPVIHPECIDSETGVPYTAGECLEPRLQDLSREITGLLEDLAPLQLAPV